MKTSCLRFDTPAQNLNPGSHSRESETVNPGLLDRMITGQLSPVVVVMSFSPVARSTEITEITLWITSR